MEVDHPLMHAAFEDPFTSTRRPPPSKETLWQQPDRLQTLNEISRVVAATLDLHTLYETIYQQISRVMDTETFFLALRREDGGAISVPYVREKGLLTLDEPVPQDSVTALVIDRGVPLLFQNAGDYERYASRNALPQLSFGDDQSEAMIFVPLNTGSRTIGALSVQSPRERVYTRDDVQMLSVIASQAAVAIENARLYEQSQNSVRQSQALLKVARTLSSSLDLEALLDTILTSMRDVLPFYLAAILLPDCSRKQLDIVGTIGPLAEERREKIKIPFGQGITGIVFQTGEALNVPDVGAFGGYIDHGLHEIHSEMAVPLRRGDTVIGVLDVERDELDGFSQQDMNLLSLFASQASIAIENARLFREQQNRVYELAAIQSIVQKLTPLHEVGEISALINLELKVLIDYHSCRLFVLDARDSTLVPVDETGSDAHSLRLKVGEGLAGAIASRGKPESISNTLLDPRASKIAGTPDRAESVIGAPLIYEGQVRGVITLSKLGCDQFDQNALRLLEIIAGQAAIAFDRARLYEELRTEAVTDDLTKLYNRRYLLSRFYEEQSRAVRNEHNLAAIMLDIDKFKEVNDRYGHDAGDVVLRELAGIIRKVVRAEDVVARYGGEEFCILLPEIPPEDAEQVAERLRHLIAKRRLPAAAGAGSITASVGLAFMDPNDDGAQLFTRADQAMYEVKRRGGNRLAISDGASLDFYVAPREAGVG